MDDVWLALRLLGVLTVANNAPIPAKLLFGLRCNRPIAPKRQAAADTLPSGGPEMY